MPEATVSVRDFQALEKRVGTLESRLNQTIGDLNKTLQHAKGSDDHLEKRLSKLETEVKHDIVDLNKTLTHAKGYDEKLDSKIAELKKQVDAVKRG
jgi:uncharacterized coiled-coil protein SlyX